MNYNFTPPQTWLAKRMDTDFCSYFMNLSLCLFSKREANELLIHRGINQKTSFTPIVQFYGNSVGVLFR